MISTRGAATAVGADCKSDYTTKSFSWQIATGRIFYVRTSEKVGSLGNPDGVVRVGPAMVQQMVAQQRDNPLSWLPRHRGHIEHER